MGSVIPEPSGSSGIDFKPSSLKNNFSQMMTFTVKALIFLVLFVGMSSVALVVVGNVATKGMGRLSGKIKSYQPLEKAVSKIEGLSDAEVEELGRKLSRISNKLRPVTRQLKIIWESKRLDSSSVVRSVERKKIEE